MPDFNCLMKNGSIRRMDLIAEHHVQDLGVEGKGDAAETDHSLADLLRITDT